MRIQRSDLEVSLGCLRSLVDSLTSLGIVLCDCLRADLVLERDNDFLREGDYDLDLMGDCDLVGE